MVTKKTEKKKEQAESIRVRGQWHVSLAPPGLHGICIGLLCEEWLEQTVGGRVLLAE